MPVEDLAHRRVVVAGGLHHVAPVAPLGGAIEDEEAPLRLGPGEGGGGEVGPCEGLTRGALRKSRLRGGGRRGDSRVSAGGGTTHGKSWNQKDCQPNRTHAAHAPHLASPYAPRPLPVR